MISACVKGKKEEKERVCLLCGVDGEETVVSEWKGGSVDWIDEEEREEEKENQRRDKRPFYANLSRCQKVVVCSHPPFAHKWTAAG
jgi:hypothetical protein